MPLPRWLLYVATPVTLAATGFSLLRHPLPVLVTGPLLCGYLVLVLGGALVLRWRVFVDAVLRGPADTAGVALTFDDGPHPRWTPEILRVLASREVKATFFVIGRKAEEYPEVIRSILDHGHAVALHSYAHDRMFALRSEAAVQMDLERGMAALERITGSRPSLFRPPIGHTNPRIARVVERLGLVVIGWTIGARDTRANARVDRVVERVQRRLAPGAIILMHDSPEQGDHRPAALAALPRILDAIRDRNLLVSRLESWIGHT